MNAKEIRDDRCASTGYVAASSNEALSLLARCAEVLSQWPKLEVESTCLQDSGSEMMLVRCRSEASIDDLHAGIVPLWKSAMADVDASIHVVEGTGRGLDLKFAAIYKNGTYLTGRIEVQTMGLI